MQTVDQRGILGPVLPATPENLAAALADKNVDHVDVFPGTKKNIKRRAAMVGKKYSVAKRYQKPGRVAARNKRK